MLEVLPHLNASLNAMAASLLCAGWVFARRERYETHRACMIAALACSALFLVSYLTRVTLGGTHTYPGTGLERTVYLAILGTHVVLAMAVPPLALRTAYLGLRDRRESHRRWAQWTLPVWLYVSVTGVLVYWMIYHHAGIS